MRWFIFKDTEGSIFASPFDVEDTQSIAFIETLEHRELTEDEAVGIAGVRANFIGDGFTTITGSEVENAVIEYNYVEPPVDDIGAYAPPLV